MSVIRVNFLPEFEYGYDAVLLTMDGAGVDTFRAALSDALDRGSSLLEHDGVTHEFRIQPGTADIDLDKTHVVWRLDLAKAQEIKLDLDVLSNKGRAGHNYVDMLTPAPPLSCRVMNTSASSTVGRPGIGEPRMRLWSRTNANAVRCT